MIFLIASLVFLVNVPFGYWRKTVRKFSFSWFAAIHIPVFISIGLRFISGIDANFLNILLFVSVFFAGQLAGKYSYTLRTARKTIIK